MRTWRYYLLIWVPFSCCGLTWLVPILKGRFEDMIIDELVSNTTIISNQDYYESIYRQKQSSNSEDHINHICEDPRKTPRKPPEYFGCPNNITKVTKCWYCKYACAFGSVLHILGKTQKEINLDDFLNEESDLDWDKLKRKKIILFEDSEEPENNCIGKLKNKKILFILKKFMIMEMLKFLILIMVNLKMELKLSRKVNFQNLKLLNQ